MVDKLSVKLSSNLSGHSYDIIVKEGLIARAGEYIKSVIDRPYVVIISDENVAKLYLKTLINSLESANIQAKSVIIPAGETSKSLSSFSILIEKILEQKPSRDTLLIALGGGVVGDLTGFAASVCLRGIKFVQIPTTLLAQVDSSVGGKTGINSAFGKNMVGSFHQPSLVLSDISTLLSLPKRELMAGYAEMLKYALIDDADFFLWLKINAKKMLGGDSSLLTEAIIKCCQSKARIVEADEKEQNIRALLNLGHTFAHALEAETGYSDVLLHGEAVAIGMIMAFSLSLQMGICPSEDIKELKKHYAEINLPASLSDIFSKDSNFNKPNWNVHSLFEHFTRDKKSSSGKLTFILARGIGKSFIAHDVDSDIIKKFLDNFVTNSNLV